MERKNTIKIEHEKGIAIYHYDEFPSNKNWETCGSIIVDYLIKEKRIDLLESIQKN